MSNDDRWAKNPFAKMDRGEMTIGEKLVHECSPDWFAEVELKDKVFRVVWTKDAADQLDAIIAPHVEERVKSRMQEFMGLSDGEAKA